LDEYLAATITLTTIKHVTVDKNNQILYIYLPSAISPCHQERMSLATLNLLLEFPNQRPKARDKRHIEVKDVDVYHLLDWCPQGHKNSNVYRDSPLLMEKHWRWIV
jgi:hypothetical protein